MNIWDTLSEIREENLRIRTRRTNNFPVPLPTKQVSREDQPSHLGLIRQSLKFLEPGYQFDVVPLIRKLKDSNPDVSQAFRDVIQLANTGHEIKFDSAVPAEKQHEMRKEIEEASKNWAEGCAGLHGIVNKMFSQLLVGGAISNEWVPSMDLTTIEKVKFLHPERIRWAKEKGSKQYVPYQKVKNHDLASRVDILEGEFVKLNPSTFRYYAMIGDAENPYGIPPYMASLTGLSTQHRMLQNIDHIVSTMGILGWAEALMEKPDQIEGESEATYRERLTTLLKDLKTRVQEQMRDGVSVGFKDDHEFEFKQTTTSADGVDSLWAQNEQQIASGLDFDPAFMGRSYNSSETMVTILFIKMISQLTNIQNTVEHNLTYGLDLFLRLRGYDFKYLKVEFNKSTITDDLKYQQAMEIKGRVALQNFAMGIIDINMYAREMGQDNPVHSEPLVPIEIIMGKSQAQSQEDETEKKKDVSERKTTEKRKPGEKRRTKPTTSN